MKIYGIDFSSAPTKQKPIWVAGGDLDDGQLTITEFLEIRSIEGFQEFLDREGPWIGGFDFPFSQPRKLIENIGFPLNWSEMVEAFSALDKAAFRNLLDDYREDRPAGDKQHLRATDAVARSISPMMLYGVPVDRKSVV